MIIQVIIKAQYIKVVKRSNNSNNLIWLEATCNLRDLCKVYKQKELRTILERIENKASLITLEKTKVKEKYAENIVIFYFFWKALDYSSSVRGGIWIVWDQNTIWIYFT